VDINKGVLWRLVAKDRSGYEASIWTAEVGKTSLCSVVNDRTGYRFNKLTHKR
jgi:hypothetical protein